MFTSAPRSNSSFTTSRCPRSQAKDKAVRSYRYFVLTSTPSSSNFRTAATSPPRAASENASTFSGDGAGRADCAKRMETPKSTRVVLPTIRRMRVRHSMFIDPFSSRPDVVAGECTLVADIQTAATNDGVRPTRQALVRDLEPALFPIPGGIGFGQPNDVIFTQYIKVAIGISE